MPANRRPPTPRLIGRACSHTFAMERRKLVWPIAIALVVGGFLLTFLGVISSQTTFFATNYFWESVEIFVGLVIDVVGLQMVRWIQDHPYSLQPTSSQF